MGKIYELFGKLDKQDVVRLPNNVLKKSIASGNYGHEKISPYAGSIDMGNPIFKYLFKADNEKNIDYWYNKTLCNGFTWHDMWHYFMKIGLARMAGFHPYDYGVKKFDCLPRIYCNDCHKEAIKLLYQLYKGTL